MTSLATDSRNDLYLTPEGNIALARGVEGVKQDCEHAMKAQLGEMVLQLSRGVPTMATVWQRWNPIQFEAYARRMLLSVPNVLSVVAFEMTRSNDVAHYTATIKVNAEAIAQMEAAEGGALPYIATEGGFIIVIEGSSQPIGLG